MVGGGHSFHTSSLRKLLYLRRSQEYRGRRRNVIITGTRIVLRRTGRALVPTRSGFVRDLAAIDRLRGFEDRLGRRSGLPQHYLRRGSGVAPIVGTAAAGQLRRLLGAVTEILYPGALQLFDAAIPIMRLQGRVPIVAVVLHPLGHERQEHGPAALAD